MPVALSERGPFSFDKYTLTSHQATDTPANRTFTLTKAIFDPDLPETLEVLVNGVKLKGDGSATAAGSGDEFYVNSATSPTTMTVETNTVLSAQTDSAVTALSTSDILVIRRISNRTAKNVDYAPGSVIREVDLDSSNTQIIHVAQEAMDIAILGMVLGANDKFDGKSKVIESVANPVAANDVVTKTYLEDTWLTSTDKTNSATVAGLSDEIALLGTSAMATANTGHIPVVSANNANVTTVAGKATEIGLLGTSAMATASTGHLARLGTADVVADMAMLADTDVIADMAMLATTDVIADMNTLATTDIVADLNKLATDDIVADLNKLATDDIVADLNKLATDDIVADINKLATDDIVADLAMLATTDIVSDLNTLATSDIVSDLNTLATTDIVADLSTVADNISSINDFADKYRIASSAPGSDNDDGDLYYNTATNQLNVYDGSSWGAIGLTQVQTQTEANNASVAMAIALG